MPLDGQLQQIIEAALMVAGRPLTPAQLQKLFDAKEKPETAEIRAALQALTERYQDSGIELCELASGWRFQSRTALAPWLARLQEERPPRYSRALYETLALIAWRQPVTRAEIEDIRGVAVSTNITRTLLEREWIRVLGYRDVPGKPALFGTTKTFLDYFNLKSLKELPTLSDPTVQLEMIPNETKDDENQTDASLCETADQNPEEILLAHNDEENTDTPRDVSRDFQPEATPTETDDNTTSIETASTEASGSYEK